MNNNRFEFKKFIIKQDACAMKIGTDAVLLGAWSKFECGDKCRILDIGTGTGILAIMAAQKMPEAKITAIEIDADAAMQARENADNTEWKDNIKVISDNISNYKDEELFDYIITNPPYFDKSLKCPDKQRNTARHTDSLTFTELAENICRLLKPDGSSYIIIPSDAEDNLCNAAINSNLYPSHKVNIITREGQKPKRIIIVFKHKTSSYTEEYITIRDKDGYYTEQYVNLTKDFYKKL